MTFGMALEYMKVGKKVKRPHWGGYWFIPVNAVVLVNGEMHQFNPFVVACLKDNGGYIPATQYTEDTLAEDWELVE